jgi:hypothetical protein
MSTDDEMTAPIYESDPQSAPESDFVDAELRHLVVGSRGRLRDARRTPLTITRVLPEIGGFEVEIEAFEDQGARWQLPLTAIDRLQFPRNAPCEPERRVMDLGAAMVRFSQPLEIPIDHQRRARTLERIHDIQAAVRRRVEDCMRQIDLTDHIRKRKGDDTLAALVTELLDEYALVDVDGRFATSFVSNPHSGELVKGHAIVLAELGLCPYTGTIIRDPASFADPWTKPRREEHLIVRIAVTQAIWAALGHQEITLYRGAASDSPFTARASASFVSATFSEAVALAHYEGGPTAHTAILCRQRIPISRLFMTFLETPALSDRYREAEAVLIGDPSNGAF